MRKSVRVKPKRQAVQLTRELSGNAAALAAARPQVSICERAEGVFAKPYLIAAKKPDAPAPRACVPREAHWFVHAQMSLEARTPLMAINIRHRDKSVEISRKYGNALIRTLRKTYGARFARVCRR
jgi:hypothetical protein